MADEPDRVLVEFRDLAGGRVAYVTLNRPDKYNGLDLPLLRALPRAAAAVAADPQVRVVILQGAGRAFCSGLDFASFGQQSTLDLVRNGAKLPGTEVNLFQRSCWAWRRLPVPVLAVTHGYCYGGGLQLALAADFRFSTADCEFSIMEAKWGLIPDMTGSVTLRELLPIDLAKRLAMTGETFDGTRALGYGLVTEVAADPLARAEALAAELIGRSPDALAATKTLFHRTWTRAPRWAFWTESVLQARLLRGANHAIARRSGLARDGGSRPEWRLR